MHKHLCKLLGKPIFSTLLGLIDLAFHYSYFRFEILLHLFGVERTKTLVELCALAELLSILAFLTIFVTFEHIADYVELLPYVGHPIPNF